MIAALIYLVTLVQSGSNTACVTGGNGFLGVNIVEGFLKAGYNVHTTVRPSTLKNEKKMEGLRTLDHQDRLTISAADLMDEGSFDACAEGADVFVHTSFPVLLPFFTDEDGAKSLVDHYKEIGLQGNENVVNTIVKYQDALKKVVLCSSGAAVISGCNLYWPCDDFQEFKYDKITEADYTSSMFTKGMVHDAQFPARSYLIEKAVQEDHMVKAMRGIGMPLASIHPTIVLGPLGHAPSTGLSVNNQKALADGTPLKEGEDLEGQADVRGMLHSVDIRDVVAAHVEAAKPGILGRYLLVTEGYVSGLEVYNCLTERIPGLVVDESLKAMAEVPEIFMKTFQYDNSRAQELLGRPLIDTCTTIVDGVLDALKRGLVTNEGWKGEGEDVCEGKN